MKEIKIERKVYDTQYEAVDGTIFNSKEECEKYDKTAEAVLKAKFNKLIVGTTNESDLFNNSSDCVVYAVKMEKQDDADTVLQLFFLHNSYLLLSSNEKCKERNINRIMRAFQNNDILLVGETYEKTIFIIDPREAIIERLVNLDSKED